MSIKKIILAAASLLVFNTGFAQNRIQDEFRDGADEAVEPSMIRAAKFKYFPNTISIHPFQFTENGVGFGLSYERTIDCEGDGYLAFYVPAMATFNLNNTYDGRYGYYGTTNRNNVMAYIMPGIKFYPTGLGRVKYSIGPSLVAGIGQRYNGYDGPYLYNNYSYTTFAPYSYGVNERRVVLGMLINNTLNFNPTPHLHVGVEWGLGCTYYDKRGDFNRGITFLTQGNLSVGYRL